MTAPRTVKISSTNSSRLPSNIPLRTLPARSANDHDTPSSSLLGHGAADQPRPSSGSDSSWTDTGDIGDQLGDEHDPVRLQLPDEIEEELLASVQKRQPRHHKKVRIHDSAPRRYDRSTSRPLVIDKEAIQVPQVRPHRPSRVERYIASIMAGRSGGIHGLTGKPLLYVTRILQPWRYTSHPTVLY